MIDTATPRPPDTALLQVKLPRDNYHIFKSIVAIKRTTIQAVVQQAVEAYVRDNKHSLKQSI